MDIKSAKPTPAQETGAAANQKSGSLDLPPLTEQFAIRTMNDDLKRSSSRPATELIGVKIAPPPNPPKTTPAALIVPPPAPIHKDESEKKETSLKIAEEAAKKLARENLEARRAAEKIAKKAEEKIREQKKAAAKEAAKKASDEKQKAIAVQRLQLQSFLQKASSELTAGEFDAAMTEAQKIVDDRQAGWIIKWQAKRLINKAQKQRDKKMAAVKTKINVPLPAAAPIFTQKPAPTDISPTPAPRGERTVPPNLPTIDEKEKPAKILEPLLVIKTEPEPIAPHPAPPAITIPKPSTASISLPAGIKIEETGEPAEAEFDIKKILLFGFSSLAVLALIISGLWYFINQPAGNVAQKSQSPSPRPSLASPSPIIAPVPLFKTDSQKIFDLKSGQVKANIQEATASLAQIEEPTGNFIHILFKNSQGAFPSLRDLASSTETDIFDLPTQSGAGTLKDQLNMDSFSFFAYSQGQTGTGDSPFNASSTNSGRLGLVIKTNSASADQLIKSLKDLEQLMLSGLKILMLETNKNLPANQAFLTNIYKNVNIRYINLPAPDSSLDYAVLDNKLIFATSKASMYAVIDRILERANQPAASPKTP